MTNMPPSDPSRSQNPPPPAPQQPPQPLGWYQGPYPPPGMEPKGEGFWRSLWRTAAKGLVAAFSFSAGLSVSFLALLLVILVFLAAISGAASQNNNGSFKFVAGDKSSSHRLLEVDVNGVILGQQQGNSSLFGLQQVTYGYDVKETLRKAADDDNIDGVLLNMNTPGGTIYGANAIADGVKDYRSRSGKPVLAFVQSEAASGGMYAMAGANKILADTGTLVGSIGVILGPIQYYDGLNAQNGGAFVGGVTTKNGIDTEFITAGRGKDMGSPYRPLTDEERAVLQSGVDTAYNTFVQHVSKSRKIPTDTIVNQIGAFIYGEQQAKSMHLIDGVANQQQAYAELAQMAGLDSTDWRVVREKTNNGPLSNLFSKALEKGVKLDTPGVCFSPNEILSYYGDPAALCHN